MTNKDNSLKDEAVRAAKAALDEIVHAANAVSPQAS